MKKIYVLALLPLIPYMFGCLDTTHQVLVPTEGKFVQVQSWDSWTESGNDCSGEKRICGWRSRIVNRLNVTAAVELKKDFWKVHLGPYEWIYTSEADAKRLTKFLQ